MTFLAGFGFNNKHVYWLGIAVRLIESLADIMCKTQLLLKWSIYLLDRKLYSWVPLVKTSSHSLSSILSSFG